LAPGRRFGTISMSCPVRKETLCSARRASRALSTGGRGGFSTVAVVDACPVSPRESVQVAVTVEPPGSRPAVFKVAELPLPETVPDVAVQFATETGTLSGLVQFAVR